MARTRSLSTSTVLALCVPTYLKTQGATSQLGADTDPARCPASNSSGVRTSSRYSVRWSRSAWKAASMALSMVGTLKRSAMRPALALAAASASGDGSGAAELLPWSSS